jgi:hypothetical protein
MVDLDFGELGQDLILAQIEALKKLPNIDKFNEF